MVVSAQTSTAAILTSSKPSRRSLKRPFINSDARLELLRHIAHALLDFLYNVTMMTRENNVPEKSLQNSVHVSS